MPPGHMFSVLAEADLRNFLSLPASLLQTATAGPGRHRMINELLCPGTAKAREAAPRPRPSGVWGERGSRELVVPPERGTEGWCLRAGWGGEFGPAELWTLNAACCFLAHLRSRRESICRLRSKGGLSWWPQLPGELQLGNWGEAFPDPVLPSGVRDPIQPSGPFPSGKRGDTERPRASLKNI